MPDECDKLPLPDAQIEVLDHSQGALRGQEDLAQVGNFDVISHGYLRGEIHRFPPLLGSPPRPTASPD